jgi:hypothetical protein
MKLNRGLLVAAALCAGSAGIIGCNTASDESARATNEDARSVDRVASNDVTGSEGATADEGTVEYARFGRGGRGGHERGFRGGRGERGGRGFRGGRGGRPEHRAWWRFW